MLALNHAFGYPLLIDRINLAESKVVKIALEKVKRYNQQLEKFGEQKAYETKEDDAVTTEALVELIGLDEKAAKYWWEIQLKINQEKDPARKLELYEKGLRLLPDSAELNGNYAVFLHDIRKDYNQAETHYRKALELNPNDANNNGNYAGFLYSP